MYYLCVFDVFETVEHLYDTNPCVDGSKIQNKSWCRRKCERIDMFFRL